MLSQCIWQRLTMEECSLQCLQSFCSSHSVCRLPPPPTVFLVAQLSKKQAVFLFKLPLSRTQHWVWGKQEKEHKKIRERAMQRRSRISSSIYIYFPFHSLELILILCHNPGWLLFSPRCCVQKLCVVWIILNMCAFISRAAQRERESNKNFSDDVMGNFSAAAHQQTTKNHIYVHKL